jgi:hypothetical protein
MPIYLNDLLHFNANEISMTRVKFNQWNGITDPMIQYKQNPDEINVTWLFWKKEKRYFKVGQTALCLLKLTWDTWLFTTAKKITKDLNVVNGVNYEGEEIQKLHPYFGRVIIKYHKNHQTQGRMFSEVLNSLEVLQILPVVFDGEDFPGYDKVRLSYFQLKTIIDRNKRDWISALENQKAIYLITDTNNGKQYIGSATGDNGMLLQRWQSYVQNGHGGNIELKAIIDKKGFEYIKNFFQYSILENYNARIDKHIILQRESWWKDTLQSRIFGYNSN